MVLGRLIRMVVLAALSVILPEATQAAGLSSAQQAFLRDHGPFYYCVDPDWAPFEVINTDGRHEGIAADLLRLVARHAGVDLRLLPTRDWDETLAAARDGRCQVLSFLNQSASRDQWLVFTDPIFVDRNVIITREDHGAVDDLAAVAGETVVLPRGTSIEERVRRDFPFLRLITTESEADAFAMVSERKADMTIRSMIVAVYTIKKDGWFNLKVAGQVPGYDNHLRIGVRKDLAPLRDILNQGVDLLTPAQQNEIANRHVSITVHQSASPRWTLYWLGAVALVVAAGFGWGGWMWMSNRKLRRLSSTDPLTGLANRASLNQRMAQEIARSRRTGQPLAVILLDLDHFKRVNDCFGHQAGDSVLVGFATLARQTVRLGDLVGRWGGEEFVVLCGNADGGAACHLAERLCLAMRTASFVTGRTQTISAGVAVLACDDTMDTLLARADAALYQAKENGRDRVRLG